MAELALIVAVASNGVIGRDNKMLWHLPEELRWFKNNTMGKPMIMGRKTFESLPGLLPGRPHIVITRDASYTASGAQVVHSIAEAQALAQKLALDLKVDEIMVIGGEKIYAQMLPKAAKIYRTIVELSPIGDAVFPELGSEWHITSEEKKISKGINFFCQVVEKAQ